MHMLMHIVNSQSMVNENAENFTLFLVTNSKKKQLMNVYRTMFDISMCVMKLEERKLDFQSIFLLLLLNFVKPYFKSELNSQKIPQMWDIFEYSVWIYLPDFMKFASVFFLSFLRFFPFEQNTNTNLFALPAGSQIWSR